MTSGAISRCKTHETETSQRLLQSHILSYCNAHVQGTLLGLLTACGAELSILKCANRVVAAGAQLLAHRTACGNICYLGYGTCLLFADGAHVLGRGYRDCMHPTPVGGALQAAFTARSDPRSTLTLDSTQGASISVRIPTSVQDWVHRGALLGTEMLAKAADAATSATSRVGASANSR